MSDCNKACTEIDLKFQSTNDIAIITSTYRYILVYFLVSVKGEEEIEPSFTKKSKTLLPSTTQWSGTQNGSTKLHLDFKFKWTPHYGMISEVMTGLFNIVKTSCRSLQITLRLSFNRLWITQVFAPLGNIYFNLKDHILSKRKNPPLASEK